MRRAAEGRTAGANAPRYERIANPEQPDGCACSRRAQKKEKNVAQSYHFSAQMQHMATNKTTLLGLIVASIGVYILGMWRVGLLEIDSAQYASIAQEMAQGGDWLAVQHRGADYLDKPPLLFWLSAMCFKLLGYSHFVFRIPALLSSMLGAYACYRLARGLYDEQTGLRASVILLTCQAWFLIHHDLRADTLLANAIIVATWQLWAFAETNKWQHFLFGFTAVSLAMMAKGPIGLVVPGMALASYWAGQGQWRMFFKPAWILGLLWVGLLLSPMLWGLYLQYGAEGPKFFFWTQSFGRITGENSWKNDSGYLFFTHTFLWAFLPWSLYVLVQLFKRKPSEFLSLGGFVLPIVALSFSQYKLPHYIYVSFPFAAILAANAIAQVESTPWLKYVQTALVLLIPLAAASMGLLIDRPWNYVAFGLGLSICVGLGWYKFKGGETMVLSAAAFIGVNLCLNLFLYPWLMQYQSGSVAGQKAKGISEAVFTYKAHTHGFDFYSGGVKTELDLATFRGKACVYTTPEGLAELRTRTQVTAVTELEQFSIQKLNLKFLNPALRQQAVELRYWVCLELKEANDSVD